MSPRRASLSTPGLGALLLAMGLAVGCSEDSRVVVFDLGAGLPFADVRGEVRSIDLGAPGNRWHLGEGWASQLWYGRRGATFAAQGGPESTLRFRMVEPDDVTLHLTGRPFGEWPADEGRFQVRVNDRTIGSAAVRGDLNGYSFEAPADALVAGTNELTIHWSAIPADGQSPILGWFELRVERRTERRVAGPRYRSDDATLALPVRVRLDYHLRVPTDAVLELGGLELGGGSGGALVVTVDEDGVEPVALGSIEAPAGTTRLDLAAFGGRIVRLSLEAIPTAEKTGFSGLTVESPVILAHPHIPAPPAANSTGGSRVQAEGAPGEGLNVIVYVVDTLRRDHLGTYGYPRPVSPELDRFADEATVFENVIGQSSWTRSSMASIFTGLWPKSHATNGRKDVLAPEALTLAEIFQQAGYRTMAIVLNHNVFPVFGFSQGIDQFTKMTRGGAANATETFLGWLDRRSERTPFFAWLHPVDPHDPYVPPPDLRQRFDDLEGEPPDLTRPPKPEVSRHYSPEELERVVRHLRNLYDAEIASNDRAFGKLLDGIAERGLLERTLIVFVTDHGEEFQEHGGWTHGHNLFAETLDVALVIRFPDRARGARVPDVVQHIDVLPTILDYVGIEVPAHVEGRSLVPLLDAPGDERRPAVPAFSFVDLEGKPHLSIVDGDWKLIQRFETATGVLTRLHDRRHDRQELENLVLARPILARYLERMLEARSRQESLLTTSEAELDAETENALRALGYLQ